MEPEVHVCEKWLQIVHKCLTATNVRAEGNKEIDILGINPRKHAFVHLESNCRIGHVLKIGTQFKHKGKTYKNELEYFTKEKFNHPKVIKKIKQYFGTIKYSKTLVVWNFEHMADDHAAKVYKIKLLSLQSLIGDIREAIKNNPKGHRDDILRIIELLISEDESWEKQIRMMQRDAKQTIKKREKLPQNGKKKWLIQD